MRSQVGYIYICIISSALGAVSIFQYLFFSILKLQHQQYYTVVGFYIIICEMIYSTPAGLYVKVPIYEYAIMLVV